MSPKLLNLHAVFNAQFKEEQCSAVYWKQVLLNQMNIRWKAYFGSSLSPFLSDELCLVMLHI